MSEPIYGKHGFFVRIIYLLAAILYWVLFGWYLRKKAVVLCYHGVFPEQKGRFEWQMNLLRRRFRDVSVTFDDAFENLQENALPVLHELQLKAIIFAVPGNLGTSPHWCIAPEHPDYNEKVMTAFQLREVSGELICIGSHTQSHPNLSRLPATQVRGELAESKKNLEQLLGIPIEDLALPHGAYNAEVLTIAEETGYLRIFTLEPKLAEKRQDRGVIGRFSMSPDVWRIEFFMTCAGAYAWLFCFRRLVRAAKSSLKRSA